MAREVEISEEQARELIELIGTDWNALLREAHFLKAALSGRGAEFFAEWIADNLMRGSVGAGFLKKHAVFGNPITRRSVCPHTQRRAKVTGAFSRGGELPESPAPA
ncbi:hypothetical protein [Mesorhizobium sp.]|uniref:hypothetical protein n=1 Tax=Mesorhizobium sp. TaxID=1871066 RepID=UPI00121DD1F9|nr:hypothetical protein [Mesorhizobium sp.]TIQ05582.1 MAG: hypothetical protein E5X50_18925 [Mesorhizobium sp.]